MSSESEHQREAPASAGGLPALAGQAMMIAGQQLAGPEVALARSLRRVRRRVEAAIRDPEDPRSR